MRQAKNPDLRIDLVCSADFTGLMRTLLCLALTGILAVAGCGHPQPKASQPTPGTSPRPPVRKDEQVIVTPETGLVGKVASVNPGGRYVILNFPIGHLPTLNQRLNVYRFGLKVGEVTVTGPQMDDNVVADLTNGEAQKGDQVLDR